MTSLFSGDASWVSPNDVENPAWHYLRVTRDSTPEEARKAMLPVGQDSRHILLAAGPYSMDHYMGRVARVHAQIRGWARTGSHEKNLIRE